MLFHGFFALTYLKISFHDFVLVVWMVMIAAEFFELVYLSFVYIWYGFLSVLMVDEFKRVFYLFLNDEALPLI